MSSSFLPSSSSLVLATAAAVLRLGADLRHTRRQAPLDVVLEAGPPAHARDDLVARPDAEHAMRQRHRPPGELGGQERPRIEVAGLLDAARHQNSRKRFARRQPEVRIVLVVAQQDVVARRPLLDQVRLERQRLHDRVGDDDLDARDLVEQRIMPRTEAVGAKVAADAVAERARFPDVNRLARGVDPQVHAGLLRQAGQLILEVMNGHGLP